MARKRDRSKIKARKEAQKQEKKQRLMVQAGALLAIVVVIGLAVFNLAGNVGADVDPERLELDPILGDPNAPITITEYAAFGCSGCRSWHEAGVIEDILAQFPGQVKFVFRDMPIINPAWDMAMGEIAQCAFDQGNDAFWLAHDTLYEDTNLGRTSQSDAIDLVLVDNPTLDATALRECVNANTHTQTVQYDRTRPEARSIRSTPTWFFNGQLVYSASPQTLVQMIQSELNS